MAKACGMVLPHQRFSHTTSFSIPQQVLPDQRFLHTTGFSIPQFLPDQRFLHTTCFSIPQVFPFHRFFQTTGVSIPEVFSDRRFFNTTGFAIPQVFPYHKLFHTTTGSSRAKIFPYHRFFHTTGFAIPKVLPHHRFSIPQVFPYQRFCHTTGSIPPVFPLPPTGFAIPTVILYMFLKPFSQTVGRARIFLSHGRWAIGTHMGVCFLSCVCFSGNQSATTRKAHSSWVCPKEKPPSSNVASLWFPCKPSPQITRHLDVRDSHNGGPLWIDNNVGTSILSVCMQFEDSFCRLV